jgi:hypothetical protein
MNYIVEELKEILLDNDYPASNKELMESVIKQLQNLTPEGKEAFEHWYDTRDLPTFDIEGITADYMKTYHHANDIAIILAYDGLIKNPKSAYLLKRPVIKQV